MFGQSIGCFIGFSFFFRTPCFSTLHKEAQSKKKRAHSGKACFEIGPLNLSTRPIATEKMGPKGAHSEFWRGPREPVLAPHPVCPGLFRPWTTETLERSLEPLHAHARASALIHTYAQHVIPYRQNDQTWSFRSKSEYGQSIKNLAAMEMPRKVL